MPESLSDVFAEALAEAEGADVEEVEVDDLGGDNPDDGADHEDVVQDDEIEDDFDETDNSDSDEDDEPVEEIVDDFNWNEILEKYGDRTVPLKVNGEIVERPLKDLPNMAMMREDYSRKTAEVAQAEREANWARDVQAALANDPVRVLRAFAEAYGVDLTGQVQTPGQEQSDPYEDLDPDVAAVLRRMDESEARYQAELQRMQARLEQSENEKIMEEVKAEVRGLREEFGDELDTGEMLRLAAMHNVPLRDAAEYLIGRQYFAKSKEQLAAEAKAREIGESRARATQAKSKRRAASTATRRFDASDTSVDDFETIGELFEIEMNSIS